MKNRFRLLIAFGLISFSMVACSVPVEPTQALPDEPTETLPVEPTRVLLDGEYIFGHQGEFTGLEVYVLESFPVQVHVQVSGYFPNGCVELVDVTSEREGNTFTLTLNTRRPAGDVMCTEALVPFDTTVALDVYGLPAGTYTVIAGDQQTEFTLDVDNEL